MVPQRSLTLARRLARQIGRDADDTVRQAAAGWVQAWDTVSPSWQSAITAILGEYASTGRWPAPWQVARIEAIARAAERTGRTLDGLVADSITATVAAAGRVSATTAAAEPDVITSQAQPETASTANPGGVASVLSARRVRIRDLHRPIPADTLGAFRRLLARPPQGSGDRAAVLLQQHARAVFDAGSVRVATIARTELVDTYRDTAAVVHDANTPLVRSWAWLCQLDRRACLSCWSMHGSRHPLDQPGPCGHPSCRCQRFPLAGDNILPTAERRFRRLPRRDQLTILGPARLELFRAGRIGWADLAVRRTNRGWRDSYTPRPLADLRQMAT